MISVNNLKQLKILLEYDDSRTEQIVFQINENTESIQFLNSPVLQLLYDGIYTLKEEKITIGVTYKNPLLL